MHDTAMVLLMLFLAVVTRNGDGEECIISFKDDWFDLISCLLCWKSFIL